MFRGHHRKVRILFGASDVVLIGIAFELAYATRQRLELQHFFTLPPPTKALLAGWSILVWVALGFWWELYDHLDTEQPKVILRDAFRQCLVGAASLILFEYLQRMDLSRAFVALLAAYSWVVLCLFRLNAGRISRLMRRGTAHYVMVAGMGDAAMKLGRELESASSYGIRLTGFLADSTTETREIELDAKYPVRPIASLPELLRE